MDKVARVARQIRKSCESVGTYRAEFDPVITRLAELILRKADAEALYQKSGGHVVIKQVNKAGKEYYARNPFLQEIDAANKSILEIEKELGLTPAALKKIKDDQIAKSEADDPLAAAIGSLRVVRGA